MGLRSRLKGALRTGVVLLFAALPASESLAGPSAATTDAGETASNDAGVDAGAPYVDPRTEQIRALIAGTLPVAIEPKALFDVPLVEEPAIQVEAARLRRLLQSDTAPGAASSSLPAKRSAPVVSVGAGDAGIQVDPALVQSREALDRARLDFYTLPRGRRAELLEQHRARQQAARPKETEAELHAREAEEERQKALAAAREARSEAERTVAEELARLIGVERAIAAVREGFATDRADLAARREGLLGWRQRVRDAQASGGESSDATYDAIRKTLRASRDDLDGALAAADSDDSNVPDLGPDALKDTPPDIPTEQARKRREALSRVIDDTRVEERTLRHQRAATLLDEISALNRYRLGLLPSLSSDKRGAITGFTSVGFDQARSEVRQLLLILRYHQHVILGWLTELRRPGGLKGMSWWSVVVVAVPWLLLVLAFSWWRRRSPKLLALAENRLAEIDRSERRTTPAPLRQGVRLLRGVHRPLEWLSFLALTVWLLPTSTDGLLEVQLLTVIVGWSFGGALVVNLINSIAVLSDAPSTHSVQDSARLRLRSLRLVGRVVVAFALVLVLSTRLVGNGTLYSWVWSTCWFAAVPLFLILVRWWRETVFLRVERARRKTAIQRWVLDNRSGWKSFFAAMIAAVQLFSLGGYRVVRNWVTGFDLVRRAHAYLFKRELSRLAAGKSTAEVQPLPPSAFVSLSPDRPSDRRVACPADEPSLTLHARAAAENGGLVVIVGGRGQGKSTVLRRLAEDLPHAKKLLCRSDWTVEHLRRSLESLASVSDSASALGVVLVDDAQALIKPIQGGLRAFDDVVSFARENSVHTLWVFAIDSSLWPFLQRARDSRPLFDQVVRLEAWGDEAIGALLTLRDDEAGIAPTFEDLLEKLPASADEVDKQEALDAKRAGYFRMVWDYARGNPGLALEVWRASLAQDSAGVVRVRPLVTPDITALESLPDSALFIVRAILQMGPASVTDVARATRLAEAQVENAFRFGRSQGYLRDEDGRVRVTWRWLRPIMALLERRHLLVNS